jgi:hypothetical protein
MEHRVWVVSTDRTANDRIFLASMLLSAERSRSSTWSSIKILKAFRPRICLGYDVSSLIPLGRIASTYVIHESMLIDLPT